MPGRRVTVLWMITPDDLHAAADLVASWGDDESRIAEYGVSMDTLEEFVLGSDWGDIDASGPHRDIDPLALVMGISIGVIAAKTLTAQPDISSASPSQ